MVWFVGCAERFIFVTLQGHLVVLAQLQNQCPQDPPGAVFEVWTEVMFVKAPPEYQERFATSLEWFGLLVV